MPASGQEAAESKIAGLQARLDAVEARLVALESPDPDAVPPEGV